MIDSINVKAIKRLLRMGWLYPNSRIAAVICPELVERARVEEWDVQRFIREALPRVRTWAQAKLGPKARLIELSCRNFIFRMMTRRPDLFADPSKGTVEWYIGGLLKKVHLETCREEQFVGQQDEFAERVEDPGQGPLEAITENPEEVEEARQQERRKVVRILRRLIKQLPLKQRIAMNQKYLRRKIPKLSDKVSEKAMYVPRTRGLQRIRDKAEALGLRLSGRGVARGRIRRALRKPRGRALPRRRKQTSMQLREVLNDGTLTESQLESMDMSIKQQKIDASNAGALKALFDSLPESLKERVDVLTVVRETFEREFARHLRKRPRGGEDLKEPPSS